VRFTLVLSLATGLCGCLSFSSGRKFDTVHVSDIRRCVTTEENLVAWFGQPIRRGNADGLPTLRWSYVSSANAGSEWQSLVVVVDRSGKVVHFAFNAPPTCTAIEERDVCPGTEAAPSR
jgi:hypothetical protein